MKRIVVLAATAFAAATLAAVPAVAGLVGNPSFSHQIPVRAPQDAQSVVLVGDDSSVSPHQSTSAVPSATPTRGRSGEVEPSDDAVTGSAEPGDDRGGATRHVEPGDDRGGVTRSAEPGDDRGGATRSAEPGDDRGGSGKGGRG
jgi:hypothetical protein